MFRKTLSIPSTASSAISARTPPSYYRSFFILCHFCVALFIKTNDWHDAGIRTEKHTHTQTPPLAKEEKGVLALHY